MFFGCRSDSPNKPKQGQKGGTGHQAKSELVDAVASVVELPTVDSVTVLQLLFLCALQGQPYAARIRMPLQNTSK